MNKRITSLLLCFVLLFAMLATAVPAYAAGESCTYSIEADKTTAKPGDTVEFTVYLQQTGLLTVIEGILYIPDGLTFVKDSGVLEDGINATLGWTLQMEGVEWTPWENEPDGVGILNGTGINKYAGTEKLAVMKFKCKVNSDASEGTYEVKLIDTLAGDGNFDSKPTTSIPAVVTVAIPHVHGMSKEDARESTCTEGGNIAYYVCSGCGKWYEDETGNVEITDHNTVKTAPKGHNYTERLLDSAHKKDTAADCRSHDTYWYDCSRCDKNAKDDPAAADKWYETTTAGAHSYDESEWGYKDENGHAHKCRYDDTHDALQAHVPGAEATETTPQLCTECGYTITPALGHRHRMTYVPANAATCTAEGSKAYYVCLGCENWYEDATGNVKIENHEDVKIGLADHDWIDATCTEPKTCRVCRLTEGAPNGHRADTEYHYNSESHWHECIDCGNVIESTRGRHNPDRDEPTLHDPIKCTECGHEMAERLQEFEIELPFRVTVKKGGNIAPGSHSFELDICHVGNGNDEEYDDVGYIGFVNTNGEGNYDDSLVITGSEEQLNNFASEGFFVRQENDGAEGWTFSDAIWYVMPTETEDGIRYVIYPASVQGEGESAEYVYDAENPVEIMAFVNTYTKTAEVPPTGDSCNMILWIAMLFVSSAAVAGTTVYFRKKNKNNA